MIIQKTSASRIDTFDKDNFSFGTTFTDHMVVCEYEDGKWGDVRVMPYGPFPFTPAMMGVNYGQACFEGMKAYKDKDGDVFLFRPEKNFERINKSAKRLAMPEVTEEMFLKGLEALMDIDREWIPQGDGFSLYIRPLIFATEEALKARKSEKYMFAIIATPAKAYYTAPVSVLISDFYSRAANGGVGSAKAAGNYAGAFYPTDLANEQGYEQIIWTDDATHSYFEESGTMNVFVRVGDTIYTPPTSERILDGVTRDSFIQLAKKRGIEVVVDKVPVDFVINAHKEGTLKEIWGVGTAVVTSQFEAIGYHGEKLMLPVLSEEESYAASLKNELVGIQSNLLEDPFGWRVLVGEGVAEQV
ncbi:branched-chain amino acid aminotransferase [Elizabethkingia miricola]|uniref:Branched-chain-amino-acid aminotransferase n=1 Tax=Elizabethkingia miricola TaxID=172045 RepID=A0ABY3NL23_ELIMR|nr:branched-chain amino acid aminotransferase [Elizabethkingia miricola]OBS13570.1 branched-chain amino acid aminotransferase [Elizabethkingia miricola]OPC16535.1 branched-chain amino acid aminotransferase [Elizabethkingia miricola]TYO94177.1 branched-chain amino acid aminotransferase [Elizabethkingia miricola]